MKILIVDDHVVVRVGVPACRSAAGHDSLRGRLDARSFGVVPLRKARRVVAGSQLAEFERLRVLRRLLIENRQVKVVVLSMHAEPIYVSRTLNAGARGYVSKTASADELIAAVREVGAGGRYVEREIAAQLVVSQYGGVNPLEKLTTREVDIVRLLGEGKNFVASLRPWELPTRPWRTPAASSKASSASSAPPTWCASPIRCRSDNRAGAGGAPGHHGIATTPHGKCPTLTDRIALRRATSITVRSLVLPFAT